MSYNLMNDIPRHLFIGGAYGRPPFIPNLSPDPQLQRLGCDLMCVMIDELERRANLSVLYKNMFYRVTSAPLMQGGPANYNNPVFLNIVDSAFIYLQFLIIAQRIDAVSAMRQAMEESLGIHCSLIAIADAGFVRTLSVQEQQSVDYYSNRFKELAPAIANFTRQINTAPQVSGPAYLNQGYAPDPYAAAPQGAWQQGGFGGGYTGGGRAPSYTDPYSRTPQQPNGYSIGQIQRPGHPAPVTNPYARSGGYDAYGSYGAGQDTSWYAKTEDAQTHVVQPTYQEPVTSRTAHLSNMASVKAIEEPITFDNDKPNDEIKTEVQPIKSLDEILNERYGAAVDIVEQTVTVEPTIEPMVISEIVEASSIVAQETVTVVEAPLMEATPPKPLLELTEMSNDPQRIVSLVPPLYVPFEHVVVCERQEDGLYVCDVSLLEPDMRDMKYEEHETEPFFRQIASLDKSNEKTYDDAKNEFRNVVRQTNVETMLAEFAEQKLPDLDSDSDVYWTSCIPFYIEEPIVHSDDDYLTALTIYINDNDLDVNEEECTISFTYVQMYRWQPPSIAGSLSSASLEQSQTFELLRERMLEFKEVIPYTYWVIMHNRITDSVNEYLGTVCGIGVRIGNFVDDILSLEGYLRTKEVNGKLLYGPYYADTLIEGTSTIIKRAFEFYDGTSKEVIAFKGASTDLEKYTVHFAKTTYVTRIAVHSSAFKFKHDGEAAMISEILTPELYRAIASVFARASDHCHNHVFVTTDGRVLNLYKSPSSTGHFIVRKDNRSKL